MLRSSKTKGDPDAEVLTRKTRKTLPARIVEAESASPAELGEENAVAGNIASPKRVYKPRKGGLKGKKVKKADPLDEVSERYTNMVREVFSDLNTDTRYQEFEVSCTAALGEHPGEIWAFASLSKKGCKIFGMSLPVTDVGFDMRHIAGMLLIVMQLKGLEICDAYGL